MSCYKLLKDKGEKMGFLAKWFKKPNSHNNDNAYEAQSIYQMFEDLEELYYKKQRMNRFYKELEAREHELCQYESLDEEDIKKLVNLVDDYKNIEEKRQLLRGRLIKNNRALLLISEYEGDLPELIREMLNAEKKKKESERDIFYIEEERDDLVEERNALIKGYKFLKVFSVVFIIGIALAALIMFGMLQIIREAVWIYLSIFACALVLFLVGIIYAKERLEKLLRDNEILQQKAAKYLNKAKIRYFHHTNYLNFNYQKLGVDSVAKLEMYYNRFIKNRDNEKDYERLTRNILIIQEKIDELFEDKDIRIEHLEDLQDWLVASKKANSRQNITDEKASIKEQLAAFETYETELWKEIFVLKEDGAYQAIILQKMEEYMALTKQHLDKNIKDA